MSEYPSPGKRRSLHDIPSTSSSSRVARSSAFAPFLPTSTAASTSMPGVALQSASLAPPFYERPGQGAAYSAHAYQTTPVLPPLSGLSTTPQLQHQRSTAPSGSSVSSSSSVAIPGTTTSKPANQESPQGSTKTGRKSKAHVASACFNCKRAHLSCDDQRPCARCVASGKQDTCYDVQHKKRGRPRLREESDFKIERMTAEPGRPHSALIGASGFAAARPIAATRARRSDSFRSLPAHGSDVSMGMPTNPHYHYPHQTPTMRSTFEQPRAMYRPPSPPDASFAEVPTAIVDIDFVILRANQFFWQILFRGQELVGRNVGDIVTPADGESFLTIRNRLRRERDAHLPPYTSPPMPTGPDPVHGIADVDVEQCTRGFQDRTYTWTQGGASGQTFPARVRLARAASYFVVITLPSFRQVDSHASSYNRPQRSFHRPRLSQTQSFSNTEPYASQTSRTFQPAHAAPPTGYQPVHHNHSYPQSYSAFAQQPAPPPPPPPPPPPVSAASHATPASRSYPPPYSQPAYHESSALRSTYRPTTPRIPESVSDPGMTGDKSRRPSLAESAASSASGGVRLPPILASPLRETRPATILRSIDRRAYEGESSARPPPPPPSYSVPTSTPEQYHRMDRRDAYAPPPPTPQDTYYHRQHLFSEPPPPPPPPPPQQYVPRPPAQQTPAQQSHAQQPHARQQQSQQQHYHQQHQQQQQQSYVPITEESRPREPSTIEAEGDDPDRPRKRARRMGIDDVLH